MSLLQGCR